MYLHGGDYNPEQWKDNFDIIEEDLIKLKNANINTITLGMFNWASLEPSENKYEIDWYIRVLDLIKQYEFQIIIGTPTAARPHWLAQKYPETSRVNYEGIRELSGFRHNHCMQSKEYRNHAEKIIRKVAEIIVDYANIHSWHINNEFNGKCYCDECQEAFRNHLKKEYGTIENLNNKWWNSFWSHNYSSFDEISPPFKHGENTNTSLSINWERFTTQSHIDYFNFEKSIIREYSDLPITTNFFDQPLDGTLDYYEFAKHVDYVSYDIYPAWNTEDNYDTAIRALMNLKIMSNLAYKDFYIMESSPSSTNWQDYTILKTDELFEASNFLHMFANTKSFLYFQLKQSAGSREMYHGSVLDHFSNAESRVYNYVKEFGEKVKGIEKIADAKTEKQIGIYFDWNNLNMLKYSDGPRNRGYNQKELYKNIFEYFINIGYNVDFFFDEQVVDEFDILIFPYSYNCKKEVIDKLKQLNNKQIIALPLFNYVDKNCLFNNDASPSYMNEEFGITVNEVSAILDEDVLAVNEYTFKDLVEVVELKSAKPLVVYNHQLFKNLVTSNKVNNEYIYIASIPTKKTLIKLFDELFQTKYIHEQKLIQQKVNHNNEIYKYILNLGKEPNQDKNIVWKSKTNSNNIENLEFAISKINMNQFLD